MKVFNLITTLTVVLYIISSVLLVFGLNVYIKKFAYTEAVQKSQIILDKSLSIHNFYSQILKPDLFNYFNNLGVEPDFDPVWMSSTYAIKEVNNIYYQLRENNGDYYYKEAAINARSTENEADSYEREFLNKLNIDENLTDQNEVIKINGLPFLTVLRRGEQMEQSCLQCHSTPEIAPKGLVEIYGSQKSFNRKAGEIIQVISVRVPLSSAYRDANNFSIIAGAVLFFLLGVIVTVQILINRKFIFKPISIIGKITSEIAHNKSKLGEEIKGDFGKEIGDLKESFNKMSNSLKEERDNLEEKVEERSKELKKINILLEEDINARKRTEEQLILEKIKTDKANKELQKEIDERIKVEKYIRSLAYHDNLTGLPNRILFYDRINIALAAAKRNKEKFAVLLLDVDNFKKINDNLGHDGGDELLRLIAQNLNKNLRESDTSARLGGDEFIVLLNDIKSEQDAFKVAEKIRESIMIIEIEHSKNNLKVSSSIGISIYPEDGDDTSTLIKNADMAMYSAKRNGKNLCKRFNESMSDEITS